MHHGAMAPFRVTPLGCHVLSPLRCFTLTNVFPCLCPPVFVRSALRDWLRLYKSQSGVINAFAFDGECKPAS